MLPTHSWPDTIFAIGLSTKAFTYTTIGLLIDEGKMDWDDSITDYLPYFTLIGDVLKSIEVTIQEGGTGIPVTTLHEDYR